MLVTGSISSKSAFGEEDRSLVFFAPSESSKEKIEIDTIQLPVATYQDQLPQNHILTLSSFEELGKKKRILGVQTHQKVLLLIDLLEGSKYESLKEIVLTIKRQLDHGNYCILRTEKSLWQRNRDLL